MTINKTNLHSQLAATDQAVIIQQDQLAQQLMHIKADQPVRLQQDKTISGQIIPTTAKAANALKQALVNQDLDLAIDHDSSLYFAGADIPKRVTIDNESVIKMDQGAHLQDTIISNSQVHLAKDSAIANCHLANVQTIDGSHKLNLHHSDLINSQLSSNVNLDQSCLDSCYVNDSSLQDASIAHMPLNSYSASEDHLNMIDKSTLVNTRLVGELPITVSESTVKNTGVFVGAEPVVIDASSIDHSLILNDHQKHSILDFRNAHLDYLITTDTIQAYDSKLAGKTNSPVISNVMINTHNSQVAFDKAPVVSRLDDPQALIVFDEAKSVHGSTLTQSDQKSIKTKALAEVTDYNEHKNYQNDRLFTSDQTKVAYQHGLAKYDDYANLDHNAQQLSKAIDNAYLAVARSRDLITAHDEPEL